MTDKKITEFNEFFQRKCEDGGWTMSKNDARFVWSNCWHIAELDKEEAIDNILKGDVTPEQYHTFMQSQLAREIQAKAIDDMVDYFVKIGRCDSNDPSVFRMRTYANMVRVNNKPVVLNMTAYTRLADAVENPAPATDALRELMNEKE